MDKNANRIACIAEIIQKPSKNNTCDGHKTCLGCSRTVAKKIYDTMYKDIESDILAKHKSNKNLCIRIRKLCDVISPIGTCQKENNCIGGCNMGDKIRKFLSSI